MAHRTPPADAGRTCHRGPSGRRLWSGAAQRGQRTLLGAATSLEKRRGMRRAHIVVIATLLLSGCHSLIVINVGIANKSAAALAAPIDLVACCAALTQK